MPNYNYNCCIYYNMSYLIEAKLFNYKNIICFELFNIYYFLFNNNFNKSRYSRKKILCSIYEK